MTEQLHFLFSLSCIGEGNGNPLQCSCLENPRDGGAWWATVYGVAESDTTEATFFFFTCNTFFIIKENICFNKTRSSYTLWSAFYN